MKQCRQVDSLSLFVVLAGSLLLAAVFVSTLTATDALRNHDWNAAAFLFTMAVLYIALLVTLLLLERKAKP